VVNRTCTLSVGWLGDAPGPFGGSDVSPRCERARITAVGRTRHVVIEQKGNRGSPLHLVRSNVAAMEDVHNPPDWDVGFRTTWWRSHQPLPKPSRSIDGPTLTSNHPREIPSATATTRPGGGEIHLLPSRRSTLLGRARFLRPWPTRTGNTGQRTAVPGRLVYVSHVRGDESPTCAASAVHVPRLRVIRFLRPLQRCGYRDCDVLGRSVSRTSQFGISMIRGVARIIPNVSHARGRIQ